MLKNARNSMAAALVVAVTFLLTIGTVGLVHGQAPFTDSAIKPAEVKHITPAGPRGIGMTNLYTQHNRVETPKLDVKKLLQEDAAQTKLGPLRMGLVQEFEPKTGEDGQWTELNDGGWLWTMAFHAPGAMAIRLRIRPWSPPAGAELIIYDAQAPTYSFGPFTYTLQKRSNEFWTPTIYSDEVRLEYYLPPDIDHLEPKAHIKVDALLNQYRPLPGMAPSREPVPIELSCHLDVTCYPAWSNEAAGVGALTYISNPVAGEFFCSGNLFNRVPQDFTPLFQTARHCGVDTQSEADSVMIFWLYQTPTCNGTPPNPATLAHTSGAVVLVDDASTDYTLIGLESNIPGGATYLGWDANYWPDSSSATGIHHPDGSYKRYTYGTKTHDEASSCVGGTSWSVYWPHGHGELEPGSSGSPVFDSSHRVRGTASCASWSCISDDTTDYGRFDLAFSKLEPFLYRDTANEWDAYVDGSYTGKEWGTLAQPFKTLQKGLFAVRKGTDYSVYIEAGTYDEQFVIDKAMILRSRNGTAIIGQ